MKRIFFLALVLMFSLPYLAIAQSGSVGIGTTTPVASAALEVKSTNQGLLPPRLTEFQRDAIANPVAGLMIWCADCGGRGELQIYNGIEWTNSIGGIAATASLLPFLGNNTLKLFEGVVNSFEGVGYAADISADGMTVGIVVYENYGQGFPNVIQIFRWNGNDYVQLGSNINTEVSTVSRIELSANGNSFVYGNYVGGAGSNRGVAKAYEWNGSSWAQMGSDFTGSVNFRRLGESVSMSGDGTRIAIGESGFNSSRGRVRVFDWIGGSWILAGSPFIGTSISDRLGSSVSLSSDGQVLATGIIGEDVSGINVGAVQSYSWNGTQWTQQGSTLFGSASGSFGTDIELSPDGYYLVVGNPGFDIGPSSSNEGQVTVYRWQNSQWLPFGSPIDGTKDDGKFGTRVAISNGGRIAIGAPNETDDLINNANLGNAYVYENNGSNWNSVNTYPQTGVEENDAYVGADVAISANGRIVLYSYPGYAVNYLNGYSRIGRVFIKGAF
jgi:hypothetical protein